MATWADVIDSSAVVGNRMLASAIRDVLTQPLEFIGRVDPTSPAQRGLRLPISSALLSKTKES